MHVVLEVVKGPDPERVIKVNLDEVVRVGRTSKSNVVMIDNFMSGSHFSVECKSNGCYLRDLRSRNGTKLNGKLIIEAPLRNGDRVFAGSTDFVVRIEEESHTTVPESGESKPAPPTPAVKEKKVSTRKQSGSLTPGTEQQAEPQSPSNKKSRQRRSRGDLKSPESGTKSSARRHTQMETSVIDAPSPIPDISLPQLASYEAVTPNGKLLNILSNQHQPVLALLDGAHDSSVLELLKTQGEPFVSLYRPEQKATVVPYLVAIPPRSNLLKEMIRRGWGHEWGVYLTCSLSLSELREYFRSSLMVTLNDGMELFSRFYDPHFFRNFLTDCSADEAEKFFGPVESYFMEDERSEILLQFTRGKRGVEKIGHLLSDLS